MKNFKDLIKINDEVLNALTSNKPIIALESTIITHGMPYPENINTAKEIEDIIRNYNVTPATIAIINGIIHIGLTNNEYDFITNNNNFFKANSADLPVILSKKLNASTTVSASILIANLIGIKFFVTGGIGGVHRNAHNTFDISSDLTELSKTPITVICAGPKAILDIPKTLEYIETQNITHLNYKSDFLPAFYSADSPYKINHRVDSIQEISDIVINRELLRLNNSVLVTNPIPQESSIDFNEINLIIESAIKEADLNNIKGKLLTPFLLNYIKEKTNSKSLIANIALIKNNAYLAAQIALEYFK